MIIPVIDDSGMTIPTFDEVLAELQTMYKAIFGADAYVGTDSKDGRFISFLASLFDENNQLMLNVFNMQSPVYATGAHLDALVAINGLKRNGAAPAVATIELSGIPGSIIKNPQVKDIVNNITWNVTETITLNELGKYTTIATQTDNIKIISPVGSITEIVNPQTGWQSVTNTVPSVVGEDVETDDALRLRRQLSVGLPSTSILDGLTAKLLALSGVSKLYIHENDSNGTDSTGAPAHSIWCIVYGGDDTEIANTIALNKTPGGVTVGRIAVTPALTNYQSTRPIYFSRPDAVSVDIDITYQITENIDVTYFDEMKQLISDFFIALDIKENVYVADIYNILSTFLTDNMIQYTRIINVDMLIGGESIQKTDLILTQYAALGNVNFTQEM